MHPPLYHFMRWIHRLFSFARFQRKTITIGSILRQRTVQAFIYALGLTRNAWACVTLCAIGIYGAGYIGPV